MTKALKQQLRGNAVQYIFFLVTQLNATRHKAYNNLINLMLQMMQAWNYPIQWVYFSFQYDWSINEFIDYIMGAVFCIYCISLDVSLIIHKIDIVHFQNKSPVIRLWYIAHNVYV